MRSQRLCTNCSLLNMHYRVHPVKGTSRLSVCILCLFYPGFCPNLTFTARIFIKVEISMCPWLGIKCIRESLDGLDMENVQFCRSFKSPQIQCALNAKRDPHYFSTVADYGLQTCLLSLRGKRLKTKRQIQINSRIYLQLRCKRLKKVRKGHFT